MPHPYFVRAARNPPPSIFVYIVARFLIGFRANLNFIKKMLHGAFHIVIISTN